MILTSSLEKRDIDDPSAEQIVNQIERVLVETETSGEEFVVLAERRYGVWKKYGPSLIQIVSSPMGWIVEYRDGGTGKLYRAPRGLDPQRFQEMFLQFARHDATYQSSVDWNDVTDL
jgi:hypothetical protein